MALPATYRPREGDILILHARVKHSFTGSDDGLYVEIEGHYSTPCLPPESFAGVHRLGFEVGDYVWHVDQQAHATVLAINGNQAWIKWQIGGSTMVIAMTDLERSARPEQAEAAE
jgi:hypothetical protein